MTIFFAQYEAVPLPHSEQYAECGGAYVNCWLQAASEDEAYKMASTLIHGRGSKIVSVEEGCREVTQASYADDEEGKEYYEQAVLDGECYVFHQWPVDTAENGNA